jgi:membrane-bound lytic murein transglycosylase D
MHYKDSRTIGLGKRLTSVLSFAAVFGAGWAAGTYEGTLRFGDAAPAGRASRVSDALPAALARSEPAPATADAPAWDLPNLDHERVDYWVRRFSTSKRSEFARYLSRMGRFQPMISAKLEERGMPQDLIYLAMIESGFNPKAYSHAHASGLWQFISGTGRRYGLDINRAVDERNDPEKATDAALDYLTDLHRQFGSWYLAAAAYNSGENRVARLMRQSTGSVRGTEQSYYDIWHRLPRETRDYVPLMVAAARIAKEPHKYGFEDVRPEEPMQFDVVVVDPATPLAAIARASGTTVDSLRRLNPQFKLARTRNDMRSPVRIPPSTREAFAANWSTVKTQLAADEARQSAKKKASRPKVRRYRVRRGDNLTVIARRHGVSVRAIKRENGLRGDRIRAGSTLRIPGRG